jgi:hypothetical protein
LYGSTDTHDGARAWSNDSDTANVAHKLEAVYGANNVIACTGHPFFDECGVSNYVEWDYNQYYTTNIYSYTTNLYLWHNNSYSSFAAFQSGSGLDANSTEANPLLDPITNIPMTDLPGKYLPGITNNPVLKLRQVKGSNIAT